MVGKDPTVGEASRGPRRVTRAQSRAYAFNSTSVQPGPLQPRPLTWLERYLGLPPLR